jgi:hypothetical protein
MPPVVSDSATVLRELLSERPSFHGAAGEHQWSLADDVMWWLFYALESTDVTLETGCGYSTIIFALKRTRHTVISPMAHEHRRIQVWGVAHNVNFSDIKFVAERSEETLPQLGGGALDLVLIDGWHAFPAPMVDWLYTCRRLTPGGRVIVDDTQIRSCRMLCDFLSAEEGRWRLERRFRRTDVFQKLDAPMFAGDWRSQAWGANPILNWRDRWSLGIRPRLVKQLDALPQLKRVKKVFRK